MYTPEQYGTSAHSNPHWTTGIIFVFYFFLGCQSVRDRTAQAGAHQY